MGKLKDQLEEDSILYAIGYMGLIIFLIVLIIIGIIIYFLATWWTLLNNFYTISI